MCSNSSGFVFLSLYHFQTLFSSVLHYFIPLPVTMLSCPQQGEAALPEGFCCSPHASSSLSPLSSLEIPAAMGLTLSNTTETFRSLWLHLSVSPWDIQMKKHCINEALIVLLIVALALFIKICIGIDCIINICMLKDRYTKHLAAPSNR